MGCTLNLLHQSDSYCDELIGSISMRDNLVDEKRPPITIVPYAMISTNRNPINETNTVEDMMQSAIVFKNSMK